MVQSEVTPSAKTYTHFSGELLIFLGIANAYSIKCSDQRPFCSRNNLIRGFCDTVFLCIKQLHKDKNLSQKIKLNEVDFLTKSNVLKYSTFIILVFPALKLKRNSVLEYFSQFYKIMEKFI